MSTSAAKEPKFFTKDPKARMPNAVNLVTTSVTFIKWFTCASCLTVIRFIDFQLHAATGQLPQSMCLKGKHEMRYAVGGPVRFTEPQLWLDKLCLPRHPATMMEPTAPLPVTSHRVPTRPPPPSNPRHEPQTRSSSEPQAGVACQKYQTKALCKKPVQMDMHREGVK